MSTVRTGPAIGLIVQIVLLAGLAGTVGLGAAGWLTGVAYGVVTCVVLTRGLRRTGTRDLTPADRVTLSRGTLVGGVAALTVDSFGGPAPVTLMVVLTVVALALDGVDGQVARRTGTVRDLGARFDMEVDAFLILVLSVHLTPSAGGWVLVFGTMRYAFVAAGWMLPWMRGSLPPRFWRKVVAAVQGVALVTATAEVLPRPLTVAVLTVSLALLVESFGRDVRWLWTHRPVRPDGVRATAPSSTVGVPALTGGALPLHIRPQVAAHHLPVTGSPDDRRPVPARSGGTPPGGSWAAHQPI